MEAIRDEVLDVPELGPKDALVFVMAAGVNFNNVWAAGRARRRDDDAGPMGEPTDFHIVGSDASGVVYAVGWRSRTSRWVTTWSCTPANGTPTTRGSRPGRTWGSPRRSASGATTRAGARTQFTKVQAHQCLLKAAGLTWEEAAAPTLTGATAYRMLHGWPPHTVLAGDVVLIWGAPAAWVRSRSSW